jgi:hypothetical protein
MVWATIEVPLELAIDVHNDPNLYSIEEIIDKIEPLEIVLFKSEPGFVSARLLYKAMRYDLLQKVPAKMDCMSTLVNWRRQCLDRIEVLKCMTHCHKISRSCPMSTSPNDVPIYLVQIM